MHNATSHPVTVAIVALKTINLCHFFASQCIYILRLTSYAPPPHALLNGRLFKKNILANLNSLVLRQSFGFIFINTSKYEY